MVSNRPTAHGVDSGRKSPLHGLRDECCPQSEQREPLPWEGCRGSPCRCWGRPVGARGRRSPPGSWCHERQALARQGVAHQKGHATGTPTAGLAEDTAANEPRRWGTLVPALLQKNHAGLVLRQSSSKGNPEGRRAGSSELPDNYEAILIGAAAFAHTTAAGDADGVTAMKRLCGSVSRAAGKPPRRSTTDSARDLLEG
ncbi:hypothetical protein TcCL_ESM10431 [Trypanosoma cruzi]|nr:hypothetical protein TcCL_ESM10431 [Trypanosoma cruzi]